MTPIYSVIGVAVFVVILIASTGTGAAPVVSDERLARDPILGDPDAPVTIVEYGAYACPACRSWHQAGIIEQILDEYAGRVNFVFRDFPVISPAYDRMAAQISQCVFDQGNDLFWAFHDLLYTVARPGASSDSELISLAGQAGVDAVALQACHNAGTHRATVGNSLNFGQSIGLRGTPSFVVNGQRIFNASPDTLRSAIEQALAQS